MSSTADPEIKKEDANPEAAVSVAGDPVHVVSEEKKNVIEAPATETPVTAVAPVSKEEAKGLRRNLNANIRAKIKEADPVSETSIKPMLNIFGDRYDLNKTTDLKGTAQGLVSFVTNYGINPNYKVDIPLIIKAFYSVFPDGSGKPVAGYDEISSKPAYHLICNHIMYRMVTLKTEIQLQNRSSLRRGQLQDIYNKLDEFLQEGQCGRFSKAASEEAFRREQANRLLKRDEATGDLMVTSHLEQKLQYIITILNKMIEQGMRDRLTQLQAQGFDCGPMESLLGRLESDDGAMPVSDMIKAYTDLKISPGGLKICISRLRQQMTETNDLSKLAIALGSVKTGKTLTEEEATSLIKSLPRTGTAGQKIAEEVAKEAGIETTPSTESIVSEPSNTTIPTAPPVIATAPAEEPLAPVLAPEPIRPTDDRVYYDDGKVVKRKFFKKEKGKPAKEEIVDARIPPTINDVDDENYVLHKSGDRFTITNISGVKGFIKLSNGKYIFVPEVTLPAKEPEEVTDEQPQDTKDLEIKAVIVGGTLPDASGVYKTYKTVKDINDAIEGLDIVGNKLVVDPEQNAVLIEKIADEDATSFKPIVPTDDNTITLWDTYKDGLTVGVPLTLLLQPTNQDAFSHLNKELISALMIPVFDATIVDTNLPNLKLDPTNTNAIKTTISTANNYYISKITNPDGLVEVHNDMKTSGLIFGIGSKPIHEQYALRLKDSLSNANAAKIVPLPGSDKDVAISNTIYYNIDLADQPAEIANSTFHMIVFVKNKKDLSGNTYVDTKKKELKEQEFIDGHFIRFIFGKDVEVQEEIPEPVAAEPHIVPVATLGITTLPDSTKIEVITPDIKNTTGTAISDSEPTIISAEAIKEEPDLAIYYRTEENNLDLITDDLQNIIQIRKDNYNINDDGSVNFVFRNKDGSIKKILGSYKMKINGDEYTIIYDREYNKFIADGFVMVQGQNNNAISLNGIEEEGEPEDKEEAVEDVAPVEVIAPEEEVAPAVEAAPTEEEEVAPAVEAAPTEEEEVAPAVELVKTDPIAPEPSNPNVKLYNGKDNIWDMVRKTYDSYTGRGAGALNTARKDWTLLYNYFNDMNNKDYYNITRYNKYLTDKQFNGLPENIKKAFTNVMNNRRIKDATEQRESTNTLRRARQRRNKSN